MAHVDLLSLCRDYLPYSNVQSPKYSNTMHKGIACCSAGTSTLLLSQGLIIGGLYGL